MNDLERNLRELLEKKSRDVAVAPDAPSKLLKRARWRQAGTVLTAIVAISAVVASSVVGLRAILGTDVPPPRPATTPVVPNAPEGFAAAVLPYASIAYPEGWYLLETSPLIPGPTETNEPATGPVLQLASFDPDVPHTPRCVVEPDNVPSDGVLLTVGIVSPIEAQLQPSEGSWPARLHEPPSGTEPVCELGSSEQASWTAPSGVQYWAQAIYGAEASEEDVAAIRGAFATLLFPPTAEPQLSRLGAIQGLGTPRVVLGTTTLGSDVLTFVAYLEIGRVLWVGVQSNGPYGGATAPYSGSPPVPPVNAGLAVVAPAGALLYGTISSEVERVESRTDSGEVAPANVVPLPPSLGFDDRFVWALIPGGGERSTIVGYDVDGNLLGNPILPAGPRVTIATGEDPEGGPWELYLEPTTDGTGLGFMFTTGGGGSGCCLQPLDGDFRLDGWGSGSDGPSNITALASDAITRVVFEAASGVQIVGTLYPVPDATLGIPQVALVIVPSDVALEGDLVAFDADGTELGRELITASIGEPPGPTPEIDEVWTLLRSARDAIGLWAADHDGSLESFSLEEAQSAFPEIVWNASGQGKPVPHQVSIRGLAPAGGSELTGWSGWTLTIVSTTPPPPFHTYCIAVNIDDGGGGNFRYGVQDAADYTECRGGWPELG